MSIRMMKNSGSDQHRYDDMINLPHPVSTVHPQMDRADRAAQFSPFAALTGYEDALGETGRLTDGKMDLEEDAKEILDERLRIILELSEDPPEVMITYFIPDKRKAGGAYASVRGQVKKIDRYAQTIVMQDGMKIPIGDITCIDGTIFGT